MHQHTCARPDCGVVFFTVNLHAKYCSHRCRDWAFRNRSHDRPAKYCEACDEEFQPRRIDQRLCGAEACARVDQRRRQQLLHPPAPAGVVNRMRGRRRAERCDACGTMLEPGDDAHLCPDCEE